MNIFKVKVKNIFGSFFKLRVFLRKICGKNYFDALNLIYLLNTKTSTILWKTLRSAYFNAYSLLNNKINGLFIKEAFVTKGRIIKKIFPRAKGKTDIHKKCLLHLNLCLEYK